MGIERIREKIHKDLDGKLSKTERNNLLIEIDIFREENGYLPEDISEWYDAYFEDFD
jgi:hypothetical protein